MVFIVCFIVSFGTYKEITWYHLVLSLHYGIFIALEKALSTKLKGVIYSHYLMRCWQLLFFKKL